MAPDLLYILAPDLLYIMALHLLYILALDLLYISAPDLLYILAPDLLYSNLVKLDFSLGVRQVGLDQWVHQQPGVSVIKLFFLPPENVSSRQTLQLVPRRGMKAVL